MSELLSASGTDPKNRAPARFFLDRGSEPNLITRDVGRIFFGRDMQCAQCHNHPLVKDYLQSDYFGLLAFISPGYAVTRKEGKKDVAFHAEKAGTDLLYDSVFVKNDKHVTGPRLPGGIELAEPAFPPGEEYQVKPANGVVSVPKFSRRALLASLATSGSNRAFNENIANRLWAVMMGRGLVQPVDLHHPSNPPSYPQVLKVLTDEIAASNFNARNFLRELALTNVYQQAIDSPAEPAALSTQLAASLPEEKAKADRLEAAAEAARSECLSAIKAWFKTEESLVPLLAEQDKAAVKHAEAEKKNEAAHNAVAAVQAQITAKRDTAKALAEAAARAQDVAKRLPKDKEVVAAAATFAKRSAAAPGELTALEKALAEKTAALKKAGDELGAAAGAVLAARAKVGPVRDSVREKEKIALAARRKMAEARLLAEVERGRLELIESFTRCAILRQQAAAFDRAILCLKDAVAAAARGPAELHENANAALSAVEANAKTIRSQLAEATSNLSDLRQSQFAQAQLKPLTPEQICFSILKVTGVYDRYWKAEEAELNKKRPLLGPAAFDPLHKITRTLEIEHARTRS